jgi:transposase
MESTGVYWIPLFPILEKPGSKVYLVNALSVKVVPGRKSDVSDCEWIQYLHSVGLLKASFRPPEDVSGPHSLVTPQQPAPGGLRTHAKHTEVSQPDEPANSSRVERDHGCQWAGHPGCDPGRQP